MLDDAAAVAAGLVSVAFALSTWERWRARRRAHELAWCTAMLLSLAASGSLAAGSAAQWSGPDFRIFYFAGAIGVVPVLALGVILLRAGPSLARASTVVVAAFCAFGAGVVATSPFTHPLPAHTLAQGSAVFGLLPRLLAGVASGGGATVITVSGLVSAWQQRRRHARALGNLTIVAGTFLLSASGLLNSVAGAMAAFGLTLALGLAVLFCGYLAVSSATEEAARHPVPRRNTVRPAPRRSMAEADRRSATTARRP